MNKKEMVKYSFLSSAGVLFYVILISTIIQNVGKMDKNPGEYVGPVLFLMLFVFSALITSLMVFGYPIWLYIKNKKEDAIKLLLYTSGWLFVMLVLIFVFVSILY